jgi:hypothetical protein
VLIGRAAGRYPAGTAFAATLERVGFADAAAGDYRLLPASPYRGVRDERAPGPDWERLAPALRAAGR